MPPCSAGTRLPIREHVGGVLIGVIEAWPALLPAQGWKESTPTAFARGAAGSRRLRPDTRKRFEERPCVSSSRPTTKKTISG